MDGGRRRKRIAQMLRNGAPLASPSLALMTACSFASSCYHVLVSDDGERALAAQPLTVGGGSLTER